MSSLGDRLREARESMGWTQMKAGEMAGIDYRTIQRWELARVVPDRHRVMGLAYLYGRSLRWLYEDDSEYQPPLFREPLTERLGMLTGILRSAASATGYSLEEMFGLASGDTEERDVSSGPVMLVQAHEPMDSFQTATAEGAGAEVLDEVRADHVRLDAHWLRSHALNPQLCDIISVTGDSMEPTLPEGSTILVNRDSKDLRDSGIFVLQTSDGLVVKRVRGMNDAWILVSDNAHWPPAAMDVSDAVIGEVIWNARTIQQHGQGHHPPTFQDQAEHLDSAGIPGADPPATGRSRYRGTTPIRNYTKRGLEADSQERPDHIDQSQVRTPASPGPRP